MKIKLLLIALTLALFSSCIKEEAEYKEADIESFTLDTEGYITHFITNGNTIQIVVSDTVDLKGLKPVIKISEKATIYPDNGAPQDFNGNVYYTVTSEDGKYQKQYRAYTTSRLSLKHNFEKWDGGSGIFNYYEIKDDPAWKSANNGVWWAGVRKQPYPSRPSDTVPELQAGQPKVNTFNGRHSVVMETVKGVNSTIAGHIPIFAGNFFRGKFTLNKAEPIKSAKFGIIHPKELGLPVRMTGHYKYKSGKEYQTFDKEKDLIEYFKNRTDELDIYAVFYRITKGADATEFLDGSNVNIASNIVAKAVLTDRTEKADFTKFDIEFEYTGEKIDYEHYDYKLGIVFSSSRRGDFYEGSVGSMLVVDDVEVICEMDNINED